MREEEEEEEEEEKREMEDGRKRWCTEKNLLLPSWESKTVEEGETSTFRPSTMY